VPAVAIRAGRDVGVAKGQDLAVIGLGVACHGVGMAIAAFLGDGAARCGQLRACDRMRRMTVGANRGMNVAAARDLLAVNGALIVLQCVCMTAPAQRGNLPARRGRRQACALVRDLGYRRMACGAGQRGMYAAGEAVRRHEKRARLSVRARCCESWRAVAAEAGRVVNLSALGTGSVNRTENNSAEIIARNNAFMSAPRDCVAGDAGIACRASYIAAPSYRIGIDANQPRHGRSPSVPAMFASRIASYYR
jgi:hypothetical protein